MVQKPLTFFDLETTGPDRIKDKIIQFSFLTVFPDGSEMLFAQHVNPLIPISEASIKVHGITEEKIKDCFPFTIYASEIYNLLADSDLVGFGCLQFDVPVLFSELHRCGYDWDYTKTNIVDACNIYKRMHPRNLAAAFKYYCGKEMENAHDATADVIATKEVFKKMRDAFMPITNEKLAIYSNHDQPLVDLCGRFAVDADGDIIFNFGNNKGFKAKEHRDYLYWMLQKDFSPDVKIICNKILDETRVGSLDDLPF